MAIVKPPKKAETEIKASSFIDGASKKTADKKTSILIRLDNETLAKIDALAKSRGISRNAWIQYTLSGLISE